MKVSAFVFSVFLGVVLVSGIGLFVWRILPFAYSSDVEDRAVISGENVERRMGTNPSFLDSGKVSVSDENRKEDTVSSSVQNIDSTDKEEMRIIDMEVFQWGYAPNVITMFPGERVLFRISTQDVEHTVSIVLDDGVKNLVVQPGRITEVAFVAPEISGEYFISCNIFCGSGHFDMHAVIKVE